MMSLNENLVTVAPIQIPLGWRGEKAKHSGSIRTIFLNQVFWIHHVPLGFRHLLESSDGDLAATLPANERLSLPLHFLGKKITVFRALIDLLTHHPLREKICERLLNAYIFHLFQNACEKPGIEKVEDRMFNSSDILINGHPVIHPVLVQGTLVIVRGCKPVEIPGRFDERVHRIRLSSTGTTTLWA
jgi:hypothetical protein